MSPTKRTSTIAGLQRAVTPAPATGETVPAVRKRRSGPGPKSPSGSPLTSTGRIISSLRTKPSSSKAVPPR